MPSKNRGRPRFTVRVDPETIQTLKDLAQRYGAKDTSDFAREMIESLCSGDAVRIGEFVSRLLEKAGGQLALPLAGKPPAQPRKRAKKGRGR